MKRNLWLFLTVLLILASFVSFAAEKTYVLLSAAFNFDTSGFYVLDATDPESPEEIYKMIPMETGGLYLFEGSLYLGP